MDKKQFDSLDASLKEKLRNCKNEAELNKVIRESGMQELSMDMLEGVSGGIPTCPSYNPSERITTSGSQKPQERY